MLKLFAIVYKLKDVVVLVDQSKTVVVVQVVVVRGAVVRGVVVRVAAVQVVAQARAPAAEQADLAA